MKYAKTLSYVSAVMLLLALPSIWPYAFYQILRWVVTITGILNIIEFNKEHKSGWLLTMVAVAILFNPIAPVYLSKSSWLTWDILAAMIMFMATRELKESKK